MSASQSATLDRVAVHLHDAAMITLYGFGKIFPEGVGETKDLRAHWALTRPHGAA